MIWELLHDRWPFKRDDWLAHLFKAWNQFRDSTDDAYVKQWVERVGEKAINSAWETLAKTPFAPGDFDPFKIDYGGRAGYCVLTLQVAVWALCWSVIDDTYPVPKGFPEELFKLRGANTLAWVALVGNDSDSYAATAGPLLWAAHGKLPESMTAGLEVLATVSL